MAFKTIAFPEADLLQIFDLARKWRYPGSRTQNPDPTVLGPGSNTRNPKIFRFSGLCNVRECEEEKSANGFTLLEMLIALSILSLAFLMLSGALGFSAQVAARMDGIEARVAAPMDERTTLRRILSSAATQRSIGQDRTVYFEGDFQRLTFIAAADDEEGRTRPMLFRLSLKREALTLEHCALEARWGLECPGAWAPRLTLGSFTRARLAYYDGEVWRPDWRRESRLPRAVRIDAESQMLLIPLFLGGPLS